VAFAARHGRRIAAILITSPDNPTGRTLSPEEQVRLARCALEAGVAFVFFDWIYHYITDEQPTDLNAVLRLFTPQERQRIIILDGITKSLGGSNIRNAHLIAPQPVADFIIARASHTVLPSYFGMAVAQAAIEMGFAQAAAAINEPTSASRRLLRNFLQASGFKHIIGQGYYAFIHVGGWLEQAGWTDTEPFSEYFGREHGLALVPGAYCSADGADWIRFSYAMPPALTEGALARFQHGLACLAQTPAFA
jgi:aspartate/methionine/tyrosine aminotransferase